MASAIQHFAGEHPVDPQADLEHTPVAPAALAAPNCDPDPYDVRREQSDRLSLNEEQGEVGYR